MKTFYQLSKKILLFLCFTIVIYGNNISAQTILLGPEEFNSDIIINGSSASTNVWFAPDSHTPIDYISSGGCTGGCAGYTGSWNDYWGNFLRAPEVNCNGFDSVQLNFDISNSYFSSQPNDGVRFYMWADGGYVKAVSVLIDDVEHGYIDGNGIWLMFDEQRTCIHVNVIFDISSIANKSNILFYLDANCGYNNSNVYEIKFDNISITSCQSNIVCSPYAGDDDTICALQYNLNASLSQTGSTGTWSSLNDSVSFSDINDSNATAYVNNYEIYEFIWTETNPQCSNSDTVSVTFAEIPPTPLFYSDIDTGCQPLNVYFTQSCGTGVTFFWDFGDGNHSTMGNTTHTFVNDGTYNITLTVTSDLGCVNSHTINNMITVYPKPTANFFYITNDLTADFTNTSTNSNISYWNFGDGNNSSETDPEHIYSNYNTYNVQLIAESEHGCKDTVNQNVNLIPTTINDISQYNVINIYPNPNNGLINIEFGNRYNEKINIEITDINGQILLKKQFNITDYYKNNNSDKIGIKQIDMSGYNKGVYFIKIYNTSFVKTKKITIY